MVSSGVFRLPAAAAGAAPRTAASGARRPQGEGPLNFSAETHKRLPKRLQERDRPRMRRENAGGPVCADPLMLLDPSESPNGIEIKCGDARGVIPCAGAQYVPKERAARTCPGRA
jgi:hypothetical protein